MATINQAEMFAINEAAKLLKTKHFETQEIKIFTDSLTSIKKLSNPESNSKLTIETNNNLNEISWHYNISIQKVKAHIGIAGNEKADSLAKR